jgi:hypothetical protein
MIDKSSVPSWPPLVRVEWQLDRGVEGGADVANLLVTTDRGERLVGVF